MKRLLLITFCCLFSCTVQQQKGKPEEQKVPESPKLVGRIATIPPEKRFVLIQGYGQWEPESGQILTTRGPSDRSANLRVTGEKLGEFAAADLQAGTVEVGDAVYYSPPVKSSSLLTTPEVTQPQHDPQTGNVQKNN